MQLQAENEYEIESACDDTYLDIPQKVWLNYNATQAVVENITGTYVSYYVPPEDDSFGDGMDVSTRFILGCLYGLVMGALVWDPLTVLIFTAKELVGYVMNPNQLDEAKLFYETKHLVNLHELDNMDKQTSGIQIFD